MNNILNVRKTMQMYKDFTQQYGALVAFMAGKGVLINSNAMAQVAPLSVWNLNIEQQSSTGVLVYRHELQVDDVLFYTQTDDPIQV